MGGIIWLASYPKSGNTWMRAFLHNLLTNAKEAVEPNLLDTLTLGNKAAGWYKPYAGGKPLDTLTPEDLSKYRKLVHRDFTRTSPDSVFVKTHCYLGSDDFGVPLISMEYTSGAIYIVRNPLDVCISMTHHFACSIDEAIDYLEYIRNSMGGGDEESIMEPVSTWSIHVESWTGQPNPRLIAVRYEDMLDRPLVAFGNVCRFLGLQPPQDRLERAIKFSSFEMLRKLEEKKGFKERSENAERFFREGRKEQWREKLGEAQIRRVVAAHRAQMARFDYVPAGY
ncbi:MAG: sulfotransferase domain-containing protein [Alphaproteobacteria bacterium]|nr:sulfotransferase domain-containing protein [Alphaproteobacteria bacterium]